MTCLPVAVIGVGHLGKEHARILSSMPDVELVAVADPNLGQAEAVARRCNSRAVADYRELLGGVQAAVVAAPTCYHHAVAQDLLAHGVALLVEKPLAATAAQGRDLVRCAAAGGALLQVGHIERFNPAFEELQKLPLLPRYLSCERLGGFSGRSTDVGVVLDVMIHDLDLVLCLAGAPVRRVEAFGAAVLGGHEDVAQARVHFVNGCVADLTASRVHPEPRRRMCVWGAEGFAAVDFATRRLNLFQPAEHLRQGQLDSRRLDPETAASLKTELFARHIEAKEVDCAARHSRDQLTRELDDFVAAVRDGRPPRVTGEAGAAALELADRVLASLRRRTWAGEAPAGRLFAPEPTLLREAA